MGRRLSLAVVFALVLIAADAQTRELSIGGQFGLGYLPPIVPQVWNTSWLLRDQSPVGAVASALLGYRSRPSLLEVLAFCVYVPAMCWALYRADASSRGAVSPAPAGSAA